MESMQYIDSYTETEEFPMKKILALILAAVLCLAAFPALGEDLQIQAAEDAQKLDAAYNLAMAAIEAEDYATAKDYLEVCFVYCDKDTNPDMYADLLLKRACINVIEEKYDLARITLDACLRVSPAMADAYLIRTQIFSSTGDLIQASQSLEKYIEITGDTALYETMAQLYEAGGDLDAAREAYDKYVAGAGAENPEAGFQAALYRMDSGMLDEAAEAFMAYTENEVLAAGAWYNIGVCKMNLGDYAGAEEAFNACAEKGGTFAGLLINQATCARLQSKWEEACAFFEKSIETEPYELDAKFNLAICLIQMDNYEKAEALLSELITRGTGDNAEFKASDALYFYRAICNGALGKLEEAVADYTLCISHGFELAQCYYQRALVYLALGDMEKKNSDMQDYLKYAN